jgi:MazG family protein
VTLSTTLTPLERLIQLVETLRGVDGCPWDREQTPRSISVYLIEEVYELVDAIESDDPRRICEELGDVLFHIIFIARIYEELKQFDIARAANLICDKMIRRHPHVFDGDKVTNTEQIRERWHAIKKTEKVATSEESVLDSIPVQLPALMRAYRVSERAARTGFDWPDIASVMEKVQEEWVEFKQALEKQDPGETANEFGDILFTLSNVARFARIHPETALSSAVAKFVQRFKQMENTVQAQGRTVDELPQAELDQIWEEVKRKAQSA